MNDKKLDLYEQYVKLVWLERKYQLQKLKECGPIANPHQGQGRIMALLKVKPEMSQKELSTILDIRPQSLGETLGKLERNGYITRTPSETDRRVMQVKLTDEGKKIVNQNDELSDNDKLFGCLSNEEKDNLSSYFNKIIDNLEKQFGEDKSDLYSKIPFNNMQFHREEFDENFNMGKN